MIRHLKSEDCKQILHLMNDWWDAREMTHLLPRFLFDHFQNTSYVVEKGGNIVGFLIGFFSQSDNEEAYIHLSGVHPSHRREGIGSLLYDRFLNDVHEHGMKRVRCITSPINKKSIAYHLNAGFHIVHGDSFVDDIPVHTNYDGKGNERVLFVKELNYQ